MSGRIGWREVAIVVPLLVMGLGGTRPAGDNQLDWSRAPDALAFVLVVLAVLALLVRRITPEGMLAVSGLAVAVYLFVGYPFGPILLTAPFVAYSVGVQRPLRRASLLLGGYFAVTFLAASLRFIDHAGDMGDLGFLAWSLAWLAVVGGPGAVGGAVRVRRESEAGVRAEQARRAVSEERLRTAQELHDVVGHGLAVIAMQAGVALHVLDRSPEKARESLEAIRDTSRESLDGLRAELEILRTPAGEPAPRRPGPGLTDVDVLVDRVRAGGVDVRVHSTGRPPSGGSGTEVELAGYRILQESLTNVLRHAGPATATVEIHYGAEAVDVIVSDTGAGPAGVRSADATTGPGTGIRGMRARAEALGGTFDAGRGPSGGFVVRARLPLDGVDLGPQRRPDMPGSSS